MEIIVRQMLEKDIEDIVEIEKEAFTTPWSKKAFTSEINENNLAYYLVAQVEGKAVAYGGIWLVLNEGHITNIAVKEEYKGKGIGNKIVEGLIYHCIKRGIDNMTLEVRKSNQVAINLYEKYGFIDYGVRPKYYADDGEDAIIMWRSNRN
ncbi:MAG: ribosomal protein S18-alanine N-acetyltransferase [Tissierella sp.]|uniref:ribosomal protein S18-alanine N-acetyltransferase n=1 Tax=Tissierella sp. TaxID=41274 RepID=UPI003F97DA07